MPSAPSHPLVEQAAREGLAVVHRKHKRRQQIAGSGPAQVDEVFAVLAGEVEVFARGRWRAMRPGALLCIHRGQRHGARASAAHAGEVRLLNILFLAPRRWRAGIPAGAVPLPTVWWRRLLELESSSDFDARGQRVLPLDAVLAFISGLARAGVAGRRRRWADGPARPDTGSDWMAAWSAAEEIIRERASRGLTAAQLAVAARVSPTQLRRVFHAARGCSPKAAITAWRIDAAKRLLAAGRCTVTQVAERVGYASVQRFTSVFRSRTGKRPSEFAGRG
jgi:AraC-like DNA-binding protein